MNMSGLALAGVSGGVDMLRVSIYLLWVMRGPGGRVRNWKLKMTSQQAGSHVGHIMAWVVSKAVLDTFLN